LPELGSARPKKNKPMTSIARCPYCGANVSPTATQCQSCNQIFTSGPDGNDNGETFHLNLQKQKGDSTLPRRNVNPVMPVGTPVNAALQNEFEHNKFAKKLRKNKKIDMHQSDEFKMIPDINECSIDVPNDDKKPSKEDNYIASCPDSRTDKEIYDACEDLGF